MKCKKKSAVSNHRVSFFNQIFLELFEIFRNDSVLTIAFQFEPPEISENFFQNRGNAGR